MKKIFILSLLLAPVAGWGKVKVEKPRVKHPTAVVMVVDSETRQRASAAISEWRDAVEADGLAVYVASEAWQTPDQVKETIARLRRGKPAVEGVVFVGDVPVAMVRNAQHMTTAFKMNEEAFPWDESSVPTDRFYDAPALQFEFLKRDSLHTDRFYYKLREDGPQNLAPEFYSARIRYPEGMGGDKYEAIARYLVKAAAAHREQGNILDHFTSFAGSGYNSDCLTAWIDEEKVLRENFPAAWGNDRNARFLNFRMARIMKRHLFDELQRRELDLMIFHEHGAPEMQYINNYSFEGNTFENRYKNFKSDIYSYMRRTIARKKATKEELMADLMKEYALKESFFDDFDSVPAGKYSLSSEMANILLSDLEGKNPQPRVVILNACYNGSFHETDGYIAGCYIFGDGRTVAVQGNTRNVLQDRWTEELIGLLSHGVRVGQYNRMVATLEGHLIGDPTFRFAPLEANSAGTDMVLRAGDKAVWERYLDSPYSDMQALGWRMLAAIDRSPAMSDRMLEAFRTSEFDMVRMELLKLLSQRRDENFVEAMQLALYDSYEAVRRRAAYLTGDSGDARLLPAMLDVAVHYPEAKRVSYILGNSLEAFEPEAIRAAAGKLLATSRNLDADHDRERLEAMASRIERVVGNKVKNICDKSAPKERRIADIRTVRNYNYHPYVEKFAAVVLDAEDDEDIRVCMAEALGWFDLSWRRGEIIGALEPLLSDSAAPKALRDEVQQTLIRLK